MMVDGTSIARELKEQLARSIAELPRALSLAVFVGDQGLATRKFIAIKKRTADELGVSVLEYPLGAHESTTSLIEQISLASKEHDGIIVQFPLPAEVDRSAVQNVLPQSHDVDVLSEDAYTRFKEGGPVMPPVARALEEIARRYKITLSGERVVVVGEGQLVGKPAAEWARLNGAHVVSLNADSADISSETRQADILILGAGVPNLIQPNMIKDDVIILDAGTSEASGKLSGDADPACAEKAALFTPVPGGIGPITVALIFKNLYVLAR